jgi:hypothetical protein
MRFSDDPSQLGTKLGPKLARMVADAIIASHHGLTKHKHDVGMAVFNSASDQISSEVHDVLGPILGQLLTEDLPSDIRSMVEQLHHRHGQLTAFAGQNVVGSVLGGAISPLINSTFYPITSRVLSAGNAQQPPDMGTLAALVARGIGNADTERGDMTGQGLRGYYVDQLVEANRAYPDPGILVRLLNYGVISPAAAKLAMTRNGIPTVYQDAILQLTRTHISPADAADMVVRGIISQEEGQSIAAKEGVIASDFDKLVLDTGEPLALQQLLEAYRRGFISEATLEHGIKQSRIRNEWIATAVKLRYSPMSVADAVNAVVQNHLSQSEGASIAQQNGLEPGAFDTLIQTAGEPLSRTEMEQLYNRGLVTQEEVNQALRESRVKNKYINLAFQLHRKVPPIFTVQRALRDGAISHDDAVRVVMESGYSKQDAEWIVAAGSAQGGASQKTKVINAIESLYIDNLISNQDAVRALKAQGLNQTDADLVVTASEFRREARITTQVVSSIRSRYVGRKISANTASGLLDKIGVPTQQRDALLSLWDIEQSANTRALTEAQIVKAVAKQLIPDTEGLSRLVAMGYSQIDAKLLLEGA